MLLLLLLSISYYYYWLVPLFRSNSEKLYHLVFIGIKPNESRMAESFLLTHSLKTVRARVPKEFLCIPAQYISIITLRRNILPPSFFFHHFFHACSTPNQDKEVFEKKKKSFWCDLSCPKNSVWSLHSFLPWKSYDSRSLLFAQAGCGHRHPGAPGIQPV